MRFISRVSVISFALFAAMPFGAKAQGVTSGSFEVSANGGITNLNGIDNKKGHGSFGFAGAYNVRKHLALVAEYNHLMLGSVSEPVFELSSLTGTTLTGTENLQLYGAAARVSLIDTRFFVPYVLGGGGGSRLNASASEGNYTVSASQSGGYFAAGGGVSFYAGHGFGIRPEFRFERQQFAATSVDGIPVSGGGENDLRATVALFYQSGGR